MSVSVPGEGGRRGREVFRRPSAILQHSMASGAVVMAASKNHEEEEAGEEEAQLSIGDTIARRHLKLYDRRMRWRNLVHLVLALLSVAIFMTEIYVAFEPVPCWADWEGAPDEFRPANFDPSQSATGKCLVTNYKTFALKAAMSAVTVLLAILIVDYYKLQLAKRRSFWYIPDSALWMNRWRFFLFLELLVILPHPFPHGLEGKLYDDKLGCVVFARLYLVFRVLRDFSPVYRARYVLLKNRFLRRTGATEFSWIFCLRLLFLRYVWYFVVIMVLFFWFTNAYIIWIFEREVKQIFDLETAAWVTVVTMTTVGYGDISPEDGTAKGAAAFAALTGIVLASLMTFALIDTLKMSAQDERARNLWRRLATQAKQEKLCAEYIAHVYRFYVLRKRFEEAKFGGAFKTHEWARTLAHYNYRGQTFKARLRKYRRQMFLSYSLDQVMVNRMRERLSSMALRVGDRLAAYLGLDIPEIETRRKPRAAPKPAPKPALPVLDPSSSSSASYSDYSASSSSYADDGGRPRAQPLSIWRLAHRMRLVRDKQRSIDSEVDDLLLAVEAVVGPLHVKQEREQVVRF